MEITGSPFQFHVDIDSDGCWIYRFVPNNSGYGSIWYKGERQGIHVASWKFFHGKDILPGYVIHHYCRKRLCCHPRDLVLCTQEDNAQIAAEDKKLLPFPCGHLRTPYNCHKNGKSPTGKPSYRCGKCNSFKSRQMVKILGGSGDNR